MIQFTKLINMIRSCNNSETSMQASVLFEITKLIRQVPRRYLIISKPSNSIKSFSVTFSCRFPICAFLICLSSLHFCQDSFACSYLLCCGICLWFLWCCCYLPFYWWWPFMLYYWLLSGLSCRFIEGERYWWLPFWNITGWFVLAFSTFCISFCNFWFIFGDFNISMRPVWVSFSLFAITKDCLVGNIVFDSVQTVAVRTYKMKLKVNAPFRLVYRTAQTVYNCNPMQFTNVRRRRTGYHR